MAFCREVCPWAIRQAKQVSTWRGLVLAIGAGVVAVNPALALPVGKLVALVVGTIDIVKNDEQK